MKMNLSRRERVLMLVAGILLAAFLSVQYLIMPMYKKYSSMQELYTDISTEKMILDVKLQNEEATRETYAAAEENFESVKARYPSVIPNEEVDRILTSICVSNRLSPVTLVMSEAFDPNAASQSGKTNSKADAAAQSVPDFLVVTASMTLSGDYYALKRLIDTVAQTDYIRISRLSFEFKKPDDSSTKPNISVFFEVTMLNDAVTAHDDASVQ